MGKIIVIEGSDASGKDTQSRVLYENLKTRYKKVIKISFPNYESPASWPVKMYLAGEFGEDASKLNPYPISAMYAIDRYASFKKEWEKLYDEGYIIITDRYTTSNMIHQASKLENNEDKMSYLKWLEDFEYNKIGIPRPDLVLFLDMPTEFAIKLMQARENKIDGTQSKDIHEKDEDYLRKSYVNAKSMSKHYSWLEISCTENDNILSIDEISSKIMEAVDKSRILEMEKK